MNKVLIILGSKSDVDAFDNARKLLTELGIEYEMHIASAHRTPAQAVKLAATAAEQGFGVIIAAAGMAAHLPGVVASHTLLPVIGVPLAAGGLGGLDALLSIAQMPEGIPVATVAIGGAVNACLLAAEILAASSPELGKKLEDYRAKHRAKVEEADADLVGRLDEP
jgi:5-(carboxyamino)imidazole ribonucleotide mutase